MCIRDRWKCFDEKEILNREYQFRMKNGEQKFMKKFLIVILNLLLQREKKVIIEKLEQINENNYRNQSHFSQQQLNAALGKFSAEEGLVGQFTSVMFRSNENYLINYLNFLIHGILSLIHI